MVKSSARYNLHISAPRYHFQWNTARTQHGVKDRNKGVVFTSTHTHSTAQKSSEIIKSRLGGGGVQRRFSSGNRFLNGLVFSAGLNAAVDS